MGILPQSQPDDGDAKAKWLALYWYAAKSDNNQVNIKQSTCEVYVNGVACEVPCMVNTKKVKPGEHVSYFSWPSPSPSFVGWPGDRLLLPQDSTSKDKKDTK